MLWRRRVSKQLIFVLAVRTILLCRSFAGPRISAFMWIHLQVCAVIWLFVMSYDRSLLHPFFVSVHVNHW
jgi:hypothetical protein